MPFKFAYLCDLLSRLESLETRDVPMTKDQRRRKNCEIIQAWFKSHRKNIDADDVDRVALLSTLLPERRTDRVYGLQGPSLAKVLGRCLGLGAQRLRILYAWKVTDREDLATCISKIQRATDAGLPQSSVTVEEIDAALGKIAAQCRFSSPNVRALAEGKPKVLLHEILRAILRRLPARDLKWLIRLILKRFDPVTLDEKFILHSFHFLLPRILKFQSSFQAAVQLLNNSLLANMPAQPDRGSEDALRAAASEHLAPRLGINIGRPEYYKARSVNIVFNSLDPDVGTSNPSTTGNTVSCTSIFQKGKTAFRYFRKVRKTPPRTELEFMLGLKIV